MVGGLENQVSRQLVAGLGKADLYCTELVAHLSPYYKFLEDQACVSFIFISLAPNYSACHRVDAP